MMCLAVGLRPCAWPGGDETPLPLISAQWVWRPVWPYLTKATCVTAFRAVSEGLLEVSA
jgi:hypothetical protein